MNKAEGHTVQLAVEEAERPEGKASGWQPWHFHVLLWAWAPAAVAALYAKSAMLRAVYYYKVSQALERFFIIGRPDFTLTEKLSFYRMDLTVGLLAVPLILLALSRLKFPRLVLSLVAALSVASIIVINVQLEAFRLIGNMQSFDLLADALRWGYENSHQAATYIVGVALFRTGALILATLGVLLAGIMMPARARNWLQRIQVPGMWVYGVLLVITAVSWGPWIPTSASHASVTVSSVRELIQVRTPLNGQRASFAELKRNFRQLTGTPEELPSRPLWSAAHDYDVILFVLETTPARCVALNGPMDGLPNARSLRDRSWVGLRHHTTYPVTSRAVFSLLAAVYPPESTLDKVRIRERVKSGMIHSLNHAGYKTAVYGSTASIAPWASDVFENLGFQYIRAIKGPSGADFSHATDAQEIEWDAQSYVKEQRKLDVAALNAMKDDISAWNREDRRYAAVYLPQISHGPWGDPKEGGRETNLLNRCQSLASIQDQWLGEILGLLKKNGRLNRTLIVFTGDHGVRTKVEDPSLTMRVADEYSFEVPFLLYAPGVAKKTQYLPWVTSHIDIGTSILDLLGVKRETDREQGMAIWDPRIQQRTTFFLANKYQGTDGYYSNGNFYSWSRTLDTVYRGKRLHFASQSSFTCCSAVYNEVTKRLVSLDELRDNWFQAEEN